MSGICGWFGLPEEGDAATEKLRSMAHLLPRSSRHEQQLIVEGRAALAATTLNQQCFIHRDEQRVILVNGSARWSGSTSTEAADIAARFALSYAANGARALDAIHGHFVIAVLDLSKDEIFLATDRLGCYPLSYIVDHGGLVFSSSGDAILRCLNKSAVLDPQALYDYAYFHMIPTPRSIFAGQQRLLPGHYLRYSKGKVDLQCYWQPNYLDIRADDYDTLKPKFMALLESSVREAVDGCANVGAFLSGGTDSSTVAGMLGRVIGGKAETYSIGFDAQGYDEMEFARIASNAFGTEHHEYYVTPQDVARSIPDVAAAYDQPYGNASAIPTYYCARMAREDGIDVMLGGDGGDELFGGNARYAKQWVFSQYHRFPKLMRSGIIEPMLRGFPGAGRIGPLRKVRSYVEQANIPMPDRIESYNLLERIGPGNVFVDDFLQQVDRLAPQAMLRDLYHSAHANDMLNRMLAVDMKITLSDNDLPKVFGMCQMAGVQARFPLLDEDLTEFASHLATPLKLRRTQLRYFFKKALGDFLPLEIINKQKHGFGLPFGVWLSTDPGLQRLVADSLDGLCQRNIVRPQLIDELRSSRMSSHAAYYGTLIWVLMMLEQWLRSRGI